MVRSSDFVADVENVILRAQNAAAKLQRVSAVRPGDVAHELAVLRVAVHRIARSDSERLIPGDGHLREGTRQIGATYDAVFPVEQFAVRCGGIISPEEAVIPGAAH